MGDKPGTFLKRKTGEEQEVLIPAASHTRRKSKKDRKRNALTSKVRRVDGIK